MTEKELMMDDYVEIEGKIDRIACFNPDGWVFLWNSTSYLPVHVEELKPIPLTPEILEKNGFVYNDIPFVNGWEQFGLTLYRGGNGYLINCGTNVSLIITAVHELQHALRLCGIDLDIKL